MQVHELTFDVDATPQEVWALFWSHRSGVLSYGNVTIEILHPGDAGGEGPADLKGGPRGAAGAVAAPTGTAAAARAVARPVPEDVAARFPPAGAEPFDSLLGHDRREGDGDLRSEPPVFRSALRNVMEV